MPLGDGAARVLYPIKMLSYCWFQSVFGIGARGRFTCIERGALALFALFQYPIGAFGSMYSLSFKQNSVAFQPEHLLFREYF
jgi:hypothetical protein